MATPDLNPKHGPVSLRSSAPLAVRARWVLPVDRPPLEGGIVTVGGGRIVAVGENASGRPPHDLGDVALLPGLVNAHSHLEFSLLDQPLGKPGVGFADWIGLIVAYQRQRAKALMVETDGFARFRRQAAERGLRELRAAAVVAAGEIATVGWPAECFPAPGVQLTLFLELLGLAPKEEASLLTKAQSFVAEVYDTNPMLRPGLSPHAPYTVGPELLRRVCGLSATERVPVAMHLAESREELELLQTHSGPLVGLLESLDAWHAEALPQGLRPLDYLQTLATAHRALVIHGNYLVRDEIEFLAAQRERMHVVYCPRTHAYFGHAPYPLAEMLAGGVRVAVGTDSRASNPDLRLLEELRHIARHHPAVPLEAVIRMGTLAGAEALGLADQLGTITVGKRAELAIVPLTTNAGSPTELVLHGTADASRLDLRSLA